MYIFPLHPLAAIIIWWWCCDCFCWTTRLAYSLFVPFVFAFGMCGVQVSAAAVRVHMCAHRRQFGIQANKENLFCNVLTNGRRRRFWCEYTNKMSSAMSRRATFALCVLCVCVCSHRVSEMVDGGMVEACCKHIFASFFYIMMMRHHHFHWHRRRRQRRRFNMLKDIRLK